MHELEESECPFCAGHESETPPETFALGPPEREADTPGWRLRVVPNKFPAFVPGSRAHGRQEVVVHTPRHARSIGELEPEELAAVAEAWSARAAAARAAGFAYLQVLVNEGQLAGGSVPHTHSQLVWLPDEPPAIGRERAAPSAGCRLCGVVAAELDHGARVVAEERGVVALCPYASRAPYELLIAPLACEDEAFESASLVGALQLAATIVRRLHDLEGPMPLNVWLHASGFARSGVHWHLEVLPRITVLAGLELGAELYIDQLAPETAAAALRNRR